MKDRAINGAIGVAAIGFGAHNIVTQRGSHMFRRSSPLRGPVYTGPFAVGQGLLFIGFGVAMLWRALRRD